MAGVKYIPRVFSELVSGAYCATKEQGGKWAMFTLMHPGTGKAVGVRISEDEGVISVYGAPWTWKYIKPLIDKKGMDIVMDLQFFQQRINDEWLVEVV